MTRIQVLVKYISSTCIALVLPSGFAGFFNNFLVIYFPFSQVHTIISSFFLKLGVNIPPFFNAATLKSWVYHRLNVFKLPGTVYHNRSSQMILVNDANYIHVLPIFSTSLSPFICKYGSIINPFK